MRRPGHLATLPSYYLPHEFHGRAKLPVPRAHFGQVTNITHHAALPIGVGYYRAQAREAGLGGRACSLDRV